MSRVSAKVVAAATAYENFLKACREFEVARIRVMECKEAWERADVEAVQEVRPGARKGDGTGVT